jgi:hypothetical protein
MGLMGEECELGGDVIGATWEEALALCDSLDWGGYDDWRLPDPYELDSILDLEFKSVGSSLFIDESVFPEPFYSQYFWTSSSSPDNYELRAFAISFTFGYQSHWSEEKENLYTVRCVRAGPLEARYFDVGIMEGDRVVEDSLSGLMWQGCIGGQTGENCSGEFTEQCWQEALFFCENLSWAGYDDWRVPNPTELRSLFDTRLFQPALDEVIFPSLPEMSGYLWSSSSMDPGDLTTGAVWTVSIAGGEVFLLHKSAATGVRCVRN